MKSKLKIIGLTEQIRWRKADDSKSGWFAAIGIEGLVPFVPLTIFALVIHAEHFVFPLIFSPLYVVPFPNATNAPVVAVAFFSAVRGFSDLKFWPAKVIFLAGISCNCDTIFKNPLSAVSTPTTPLLVVAP